MNFFTSGFLLPQIFFFPESDFTRHTLKQTTNERLNLNESVFLHAATVLTGRRDNQLPATKCYITNSTAFVTTIWNRLVMLKLLTRVYEMSVSFHLLVLWYAKEKVVTMFCWNLRIKNWQKVQQMFPASSFVVVQPYHSEGEYWQSCWWNLQLLIQVTDF